MFLFCRHITIVLWIYLQLFRQSNNFTGEDIKALVEFFNAFFCAQYKFSKQFTDGAIEAMTKADWPNNARELRYIIERLVLTVDNPLIDTTHLPKIIFGISDPGKISDSEESEDFEKRVADFECSLIRDAYEKYGSSRKIAEHLNISQTKANNLLKKYVRDL